MNKVYIKQFSVLLGWVTMMGWSPFGWAQAGDSAMGEGEPAQEMLAGDEEALTIPAEEPPQSAYPNVVWYGYVRAAYEHVQNDPNFDFIGNNNGFVLHNARLGVDVWFPDFFLGALGLTVSIDGAADLRESVNTPLGDLDVRLRDAFITLPFLRVGQFKAPFSAEEMRSTGNLPFVSRAVGLEGVPVGRGFEQAGIVIDRQLGVMSTASLAFFDLGGPIGVTYYLALMNGNGTNAILNDNNDVALGARLELFWSDYFTLGGSLWTNDRTVDELPNLYQENDFGISADLLIQWNGLEVFGQYTTLTTEYPTVGAPERKRMAFHVHALYQIDQLVVPFAPGYRFAYYHPWAQGGDDTGGVDLDTFKLMYHTLGLSVWIPKFPAVAIVNYTFTIEDAPRELENDRLEVMLQVDF